MLIIIEGHCHARLRFQDVISRPIQSDHSAVRASIVQPRSESEYPKLTRPSLHFIHGGDGSNGVKPERHVELPSLNDSAGEDAWATQ